MLKIFLPFLLIALFAVQFGCSSKPAASAPSETMPYWVKECSFPNEEWYCGTGASEVEAKGKMVSQIRERIKSESSSEIEETKTQEAEKISKKYKQKVEVSTGDIEAVGMEKPYTSPNGTVHVAVKKANLADFYSYKIKSFFTSADIEFTRAKAYAEQGDTKSALDKVSAIKDTLENNMDSWVEILKIADGSGSESASLRKKELLLLADSLNRANTAKELVRQLKPMGASLGRSVNIVISEKHPKRKNEAWQETRDMWRKFVPLLNELNGLDKEKAAPFEPMRVLFTKARDDYQGYCKTAKLYWNPEKNDIFSNIAFSRLSKNLELTNASCNGHGISLVYKNTGHKCKYAGNFKCSHEPSLIIASCRGENYGSLKEPSVDSHQKAEDVALKELHKEFEAGSFWDDWEHKIKQWRPICE